MNRKDKSIEILKKEVESIEIDEVYITKKISVSDIDPENSDNNIIIDGEIEIYAHYEDDEFRFSQAGWVINSASFSGWMYICDEDCKPVSSEELIILNII